MNRIDPSKVAERFRELDVPVCGGTLGVKETGGTFVLRDPHIGCCCIGILVVGRCVPTGFSAFKMQHFVNETLGISQAYAMGLFDGFAGWNPIQSINDESDWQAEYHIGQNDGAMAWRMSNPVQKARLTLSKAARIITEVGWTRGMIKSRGGVAVDGAIRMALWGHVGLPLKGLYDYEIAIDMLEIFLRKRHDMPNLTAPWWNDNICVSGVDAIATLMQIASM